MSLEITIRPSEKLSEAEIKFLESGEINNVIVDCSGDITVIKVSKVNPNLLDEFLSVEYLIKKHPTLSHELAENLLEFCKINTIRYKVCYGDGSIMFPKWQAELLKQIKMNVDDNLHN